MTAAKRSQVSEWHAPDPNSKENRRHQRTKALNTDDLAQSLALLAEQQAKVAEGLRHLNSHFIPVAVQPLVSQAIKTSNHTQQHVQSALLLLQAGAVQ